RDVERLILAVPLALARRTDEPGLEVARLARAGGVERVRAGLLAPLAREDADGVSSRGHDAPVVRDGDVALLVEDDRRDSLLVCGRGSLRRLPEPRGRVVADGARRRRRGRDRGGEEKKREET